MVKFKTTGLDHSFVLSIERGDEILNLEISGFEFVSDFEFRSLSLEATLSRAVPMPSMVEVRVPGRPRGRSNGLL